MGCEIKEEIITALSERGSIYTTNRLDSMDLPHIYRRLLLIDSQLPRTTDKTLMNQKHHGGPFRQDMGIV